MAKDILLYGSIWEYNALYFFDQIAAALKDDSEADLVLRINCEGGSPEYGMSMIEKVQEMTEQFSVKVGAMAHSMGLFFLAYVDTDKVECIDTTQAVLHRAAYPDWIEAGQSFPDSIYAQILTKTNKDLEKAFRAKVNVEILEALPQFKDKNMTLKDIFSMDGREEVLLTAQDLKKIGLVSKINKITPAKNSEIKAQVETFKKCRSLEDFKMAAQAIDKTVTNPEQNPTVMTTVAELKEKFPHLYAQAIAEAHEAGKKEGIAAEADRVGACMVFAHLDPKGVKEIIASGKPMTATQMAEFSLKALSPETLKSVAAENTPVVKTGQVADGKLTEAQIKEKELADFMAKAKGGSVPAKGEALTLVQFRG